MLDPIRIVHEAGHLAVKMSGEFSEHDTARLLRVIVLACADEGPKKLLIDIREVTGRPPNLQSYGMAKMSTGLLSKWTRLALICTREQMAKTFFDSVAFSRNVVVKAFADPQSAADWLREQTPDE